jgi:RNA polymerase sigma-70 factor (ECF subfamily)
MFDNTDHYSLRNEVNGGLTRYYVSFADGQGILRETEVSRPVYLEFLRFIKVERNLRRWDERHTIYADLNDEALINRALCFTKSAEEMAFDSLLNEQLRLAIQGLTDIQCRRFALYYEFGLSYDQIAEIEGCSFVAVKYTIDKAKAAIKKRFSRFSD